MGRCQAKTKSGHRCKKLAREDRMFCHQHKNRIDGNGIIAITAGVVIGNAIFPGLGGILVGGAIGKLVKENSAMSKKVFVSFDFDNDKK